MELNGETLRFIREHCKDDVRSLALQAPKYPGVDMPVALTQIAGRQAAAGAAATHIGSKSSRPQIFFTPSHFTELVPRRSMISSKLYFIIALFCLTTDYTDLHRYLY